MMATDLHHIPSQRDVQYSCGSCGYALNLRSSSRNTTNIGSNYGKAIKKGVVSFVSIDDSRFGHVDESIGCFRRRRRTKLICRKCCNQIGVVISEGSEPIRMKYDIKISALQPFGS